MTKEVVHSELEDVEANERDEDEAAGFSGPWYAFPPMRNALVSGALLLLGWLIPRFGVPDVVPNILFGLAILVGAYYWAREGVEEFVVVLLVWPTIYATTRHVTTSATSI